MDILSIGQVARRAGVGVETVRFYEREGLLEEPPLRHVKMRKTAGNDCIGTPVLVVCVLVDTPGRMHYN